VPLSYAKIWRSARVLAVLPSTCQIDANTHRTPKDDARNFIDTLMHPALYLQSSNDGIGNRQFAAIFLAAIIW